MAGLEPATSAVTGRRSKPTELHDHTETLSRMLDIVTGETPNAGFAPATFSLTGSCSDWTELIRQNDDPKNDTVIRLDWRYQAEAVIFGVR